MSWQPVVSKKKPWIKQFKSLHLIYIYDFRPHKTYPRFLFGVSSTRHYYTHLISTIGCSVVIDRSFDPCFSIICGTLSVHDIASQSLIMMKKKTISGILVKAPNSWWYYANQFNLWLFKQKISKHLISNYNTRHNECVFYRRLYIESFGNMLILFCIVNLPNLN